MKDSCEYIIAHELREGGNYKKFQYHKLVLLNIIIHFLCCFIEQVNCAKCNEEMQKKFFERHNRMKHCGLACIEGADPIVSYIASLKRLQNSVFSCRGSKVPNWPESRGDTSAHFMWCEDRSLGSPIVCVQRYYIDNRH